MRLDLMACPICDGVTTRLFAHRDYWIRACQICNHRTAEIVPTTDHIPNTYNDDYFEGGQAGYPDYLGEADILIDHGHRYARLLSDYTKPGRVLDVGAAAGFLLKGYVESGWCGEGVEPNSKMAEYGSEDTSIACIPQVLRTLDPVTNSISSV